MEHLYYTSCLPGQSLGGAGGFQVRAASPSLSMDRMRAAIRYGGYTLPAVDAQLSPDAAPVRLALLNVERSGKIASHSACAGRDPSTGRYGNFFSHILVDSSGALTARCVIESWGSAFWRRADGDDVAVHLPDVEPPPPALVLNDELLCRALDDSRFSEMFRFALDAVLVPDAGRRVFLAAPADAVAMCVYGVTRALPAATLHGFTFSTYEADPLNCPAQLIGAWRGTRADTELPGACYENGCFGFNASTGRKSDLPAETPLTAFIIAVLQSGNLGPLDEFLRVCVQAKVESFPALETLHLIKHQPRDLAGSDWSLAAKHPYMAQQVFSNEQMSDRLMDWVIANPATAGKVIAAMKEALHSQPALIERFGRLARHRAIAACRESNYGEIRALMADVIQVCTPQFAGTCARHLAEAAPDPGAWPWPVRELLLRSYFGIADGQPATPSDFPLPLLAVRSEDIPALLDLALPPRAVVAGLLHALSITAGRLDTVTATALSRHPALVIQTIQAAVSDGNAETAIAIFRSVAATAPCAELFDRLIEQGTPLPLLMDPCLAPLMDSKVVDPVDAVRRHGSNLIDCLEGSRSLQIVVRCIFATSATRGAHDTEFDLFLGEIVRRRAVPEEQLMRLNSHHVIRQFVASPSLERDALKHLAAALGAEQDRQFVESQVITALSNALLAQADCHDCLDDLTKILTTLASVPGDLDKLFVNLLSSCGQSPQFWRHADLVCAFAAIGLGATDIDAGLAGSLDDVTIQLIQQVVRRSRHRVYYHIDEQASKWPSGARRRWRILSHLVRPAGFIGVILRPWRAKRNWIIEGSRQHD